MYNLTNEDLKLLNDAIDSVIEMTEELLEYKKKNGENERYKKSKERLNKLYLAFNSAFSAVGKYAAERNLRLKESEEKMIILDELTKLKKEIEIASRI